MLKEKSFVKTLGGERDLLFLVIFILFNKKNIFILGSKHRRGSESIVELPSSFALFYLL